MSKLLLNYLTLRNVHFSDDCALIASYSAQVYCLYNISPYSVSPSAMSRLLCITPVSFEKRLLFSPYQLSVSTLWRVLGEKIPVSGFMSQRLVSSNPSLSLLIASLYRARSNTPGSVFVSISCWITGAMQKTIWHEVVLKRASLCDAVLPCLL